VFFSPVGAAFSAFPQVSVVKGFANRKNINKKHILTSISGFENL